MLLQQLLAIANRYVILLIIIVYTKGTALKLLVPFVEFINQISSN